MPAEPEAAAGDEADPPRRERGRRDQGRTRGPVRESRPEGEHGRRPRRERDPQRRSAEAAPASAPPGRRRPQETEPESRAVGFSDHVPAFLLRPVRAPRMEEAVEDA